MKYTKKENCFKILTGQKLYPLVAVLDIQILAHPLSKMKISETQKRKRCKTHGIL
jgi:hypothetical protein